VGPKGCISGIDVIQSQSFPPPQVRRRGRAGGPPQAAAPRSEPPEGHRAKLASPAKRYRRRHSQRLNREAAKRKRDSWPANTGRAGHAGRPDPEESKTTVPANKAMGGSVGQLFSPMPAARVTRATSRRGGQERKGIAPHHAAYTFKREPGRGKKTHGPRPWTMHTARWNSVQRCVRRRRPRAELISRRRNGNSLTPMMNATYQAGRRLFAENPFRGPFARCRTALPDRASFLGSRSAGPGNS